MSNTKLVHDRFWRTMGERFGKRWLDEYGEEPSRAWKDLIDRFTPDNILNALERLKDRAEGSRNHPPTHGEFEALLYKSQNAKRTDGVDYTRRYWRSVILATLHRHGVLCNLLTRDAPDPLAALPPDVYPLALSLCQQLLDDSCDAERKNGQRTPGMENRINEDIWALLRIYRRADPPAIPAAAPPAQQLSL